MSCPSARNRRASVQLLTRSNRTITRVAKILRKIKCKNRRDGGVALPSMRRRSARKALFRKLVEIVPPVFIAILTEFEKILPTKDSGRVHVVERQPHRIIADRMHFEDLHRRFAADGA